MWILPAIHQSTRKDVEERAIGTNNVTSHGFENLLNIAITNMLDRLGVLEFINNQNNPPSNCQCNSFLVTTLSYGSREFFLFRTLDLDWLFNIGPMQMIV